MIINGKIDGLLFIHFIKNLTKDINHQNVAGNIRKINIYINMYVSDKLLHF